MNKTEMTEKIFAAKKTSKMSWEQLGERIGKSRRHKRGTRTHRRSGPL